MRTNIDLDDELLRAARRFSTSHTKRGIVDEALRTFVELKTREEGRLAVRERMEALRGRLAGQRMRPTSAELIRRDRDSR